MLLRKANKRTNQKKEPEAINRSISQVTEFISLVSELELFVEDIVGRVRNWNRTQVEFEMEVGLSGIKGVTCCISWQNPSGCFLSFTSNRLATNPVKLLFPGSQLEK